MAFEGVKFKLLIIKYNFEEYCRRFNENKNIKTTFFLTFFQKQFGDTVKTTVTVKDLIKDKSTRASAKKMILLMLLLINYKRI